MDKASIPQFISLKEAGKISGYNPDYLGQLIRKGKLRAVRIARNWFVPKQEIKKIISSMPDSNQQNILLTTSLKLLVAILFLLIAIGFIFISPQFSTRRDNLPQNNQSFSTGENLEF